MPSPPAGLVGQPGEDLRSDRCEDNRPQGPHDRHHHDARVRVRNGKCRRQHRGDVARAHPQRHDASLVLFHAEAEAVGDQRHPDHEQSHRKQGKARPPCRAFPGRRAPGTTRSSATWTSPASPLTAGKILVAASVGAMPDRRSDQQRQQDRQEERLRERPGADRQPLDHQGGHHRHQHHRADGHQRYQGAREARCLRWLCPPSAEGTARRARGSRGARRPRRAPPAEGPA